MNHPKIPTHQSVNQYHIIQIKDHFFRTPHERDAIEYPEYFTPQMQTRRFDQNDPNYEYSQLSPYIEDAYVFGRVPKLPKYTLDISRYWGDGPSAPATLDTVVDHFKRVYQTDAVRPVTVTRTVTHEYDAPPYPPNQ